MCDKDQPNRLFQALIISLFCIAAVSHAELKSNNNFNGPLPTSAESLESITELITGIVKARPETPMPSAQCTDFDRPGAVSNIKMESAFINLKFKKATAMVMIPGTNDMWAISQQEGIIKRFPNKPEVQTAEVILDIQDRVADSSNKAGDWGLQSIAFHPDFIKNGYLYTSYSSNDKDNREVISILSRFKSTDGVTFDPNSEEILIHLIQENPIHGIGQLSFGPDGYLYVGFGDGGVSEKAQQLDDFRGKILRIDVKDEFPYKIPLGNPFAGTGMGEEIYALGFRNPWRFSFDKETAHLYVADVGEASREEVDLIEAGGNYGWPIMEGSQCVESACDNTDLHLPVYEYSHDQGCAIIGGYIYRGENIPALQGQYIFGDFCASELRAVDLNANPPKKDALDTGLISNTGFGQSNNGELFTLSFLTGNIHQVLPRTESAEFLKPLPEKLSESGCLSKKNIFKAKRRLIPYEVNTSLWSDAAEKMRWISLPHLKQIKFDEDAGFLFPIGTVLIKEFAFDGNPFETRLLIRHRDGLWGGYSYEWRDDGTDADLLETGKTKVVGPNVSWDYPSREQCMICHSAAKHITLGPEIAQLNRYRKRDTLPGKYHQLKRMNRLLMFSGGLPDTPSKLPSLSSIHDENKSVTERARSYLHANCSHCHLPGGPTPVSIDFRYDTPINEMNLCGVSPTRGDFDLSVPYLIDPGNPDNSIILSRMLTLNHRRMPPIGTSVIDEKAIQLISNWISDSSICDTKPD